MGFRSSSILVAVAAIFIISGKFKISKFFIIIFFTILFNVSDFTTVNSLSLPHRFLPGPPRGPRPPQFFPRLGRPSSNLDRRSLEEDSDEDENESQARVEPQITPLNRDECLAKLLCGMSVPVTGGGSPKNGYYSEYANIVAKFFEAFP